MHLFKVLAISIILICALGITIIAWRRIPESKSSQRVPMYLSVVLFFGVAALLFFFGPGEKLTRETVRKFFEKGLFYDGLSTKYSAHA